MQLMTSAKDEKTGQAVPNYTAREAIDCDCMIGRSEAETPQAQEKEKEDVQKSQKQNSAEEIANVRMRGSILPKALQRTLQPAVQPANSVPAENQRNNNPRNPKGKKSSSAACSAARGQATVLRQGQERSPTSSADRRRGRPRSLSRAEPSGPRPWHR